MAMEYSIRVTKDGKFYVGYCLEIPQAVGQGNTKKEAIEDTKAAIKLCREFLDAERKNHIEQVISVSI